MATLDQVIAQMMSADMPPVPVGFPSVLGKVVRYGPKKKAWYRLREYTTRTGVRLYAGQFGMWRGADPGTVKVEFERDDIDQADLQDIRRRHAELEAAEEARRDDRARQAAGRARSQWNEARATGESPYLQRKGVEPEKGLRFSADGTLLVPMIRYDVPDKPEPVEGERPPLRLVGLQKIAPDGSKRFNKGMAKSGAACRLGKAPKDGEPILLAEGVATALSVRQAIKQSRAVFVAFDAGNLLPVAKILRATWPKSPLVICADDDAYLEGRLNKMLRDEYGVTELVPVPETEAILKGAKGEITLRGAWDTDPDGVPLITFAVSEGDRLYAKALTNAGRTKAAEAAREVGNARVCWPVFKDRALPLDPDAPKLTDFNDLHACEGLDAVERQLAGWLNGLDFSNPKTSAAPKGKDAAAAEGNGKGGDGDVDWDDFWKLVHRFTLIYPTDTAYDHELGDIVKIEHMRLMFGSKYVGMWLNSKKRRSVYLQDVVFEPGAPPDPKKINLFRGFAIEPSEEGGCGLLLELLHWLCEENDAVFLWVLRWLAYPLQHPGAKMQTAIVMHGKEGAGKNRFFDALRQIYGVHAGIITQRQLEADFQTWLSAKLFLIANEVVTRQEMQHQQGYLKNLITEPEIWINRKNKDERCEANHVNIVFFSNTVQPVQISADDRRFLVVKTPPARDADFYVKVSEELAAGGAAALYHYLLQLDLEDFGPHTKPIETAAKRDLIAVGMTGPQLFWTDIHDGEIPLPYGPALVEHVYKAFLTWCRRNGEKMPARINRFVPDFMSLNGIQRKRMHVPAMQRLGGEYIALADRQYRQVLLMGSAKEGEEVDAWVKRGVVEFARAMDAYCEGPQS